ncbi:MAG: amidophosphoribosyltransferase [Oligoflexales bacterium]
MDKLQEECAVVGVIGDSEAANLIYLGLYALQHRGQEATGIVTMGSDGKPRGYKNFGLVKETYTREILNQLEGSIGIGHNRYSTQGGPMLQNIQPFNFNTIIGPLAIAQNGQLTNADIIKKELEQAGSIFQSTSDTEVFTHLLARSKADNLLERIFEVMKIVKGAYALTLMGQNKLFAIRDPYGFRPLVLGRKGKATVVASESCALDLIDATFVREIKPGEVVEIHESGETISYFPIASKPKSYCSFEPIYFSRPDSRIDETSVYDVRKNIGRVLAKESHVPSDIVIPLPDSGVPMAVGYAAEAGIPFEVGLMRNHYVGRTFIEPSQSIRDFGVRLKHNAIPSVVEGKRIVVVDDSLVRGTTSVKIMRMLRKAGAKEIHLRLGCPPIRYSCYYGVDTPDREQLLAAQKNVHEIRDLVGVDSIAFLSLSGLKEALGPKANDHCYACFTGKYPEDVYSDIKPQRTDKGEGPGLRSGCGN